MRIEIPRINRSILFCNKIAVQIVQPRNWRLKRKKNRNNKKSERFGIDGLGLSGMVDAVNPPMTVKRTREKKCLSSKDLKHEAKKN
jgi:hypothetical protein